MAKRMVSKHIIVIKHTHHHYSLILNNKGCSVTQSPSIIIKSKLLDSIIKGVVFRLKSYIHHYSSLFSSIMFKVWTKTVYLDKSVHNKIVQATRAFANLEITYCGDYIEVVVHTIATPLTTITPPPPRRIVIVDDIK